MRPAVNVGKAISSGLDNLKENFWPFVLIIIILGIFESIGNSGVYRQGVPGDYFQILGSVQAGFLAFLIAVFIKPVFEYGARLQFARGNRGQEVKVLEIARGFNARESYFDIILTNLLVWVLIIAGLICFILPGIYVACRTILSSYLVMDKGLAPRQAVRASWELTRDFWPQVILLGLVSAVMFFVGLLLLIIGLIPAFIWIEAMFASFYQQIIDVHDDDFLRSLDIEP